MTLIASIMVAAAAPALMSQTLSTTLNAGYMVRADEAAFSVVIGAPQLVPTAQVLRALADFGVKEENLTSVATSRGQFGLILTQPPIAFAGQTVIWTLEFRVPAAQLKDTSDRLDALSRRLPTPFSTLSYAGGLASSAKVFDDASATAIAGMVTEATRTVDSMARAAGVTPAPLVNLLENTSSAQFLRSTLAARTFLSATFGQSGVRSLSTSCSYRTSVGADVATFRVNVTSPFNVTREQTLAALAPSGITERDLVEVNWSLPSGPIGLIGRTLPGDTGFTYVFELRQPIAAAAALLERLAGLERTPPSPVGSVAYGFGLTVSSLASDQAYPKAVQDALGACRSRGDAIARAAGMKLGAARAVTVGFSSVPVGVIASFSGSFGGPAVQSDLTLSLPINVIYALE